MSSQDAFVVDDSVMAFFNERSKREREELLRIFKSLADDPYQRGDWRQKAKSGRDLQVKRFGKWLLTFWLDSPVLEVKIVDVIPFTRNNR
jgi:hypothetical protein